LIATGRAAHLATVDPDGSPQLSVVWVGVEGNDIYFTSLGPRRKVDNIARDPRVSISIASGVLNEHGLEEHIVVRGTAHIEAGDGKRRLGELADVYLGPGSGFPPADAPDGVTVFIAPTHIGGVGPWVEPPH
jgi:PPOX class probable F420-dependent enzyme